MKLGRFAVAAVALGAVMFSAPQAEAANGSNYLHLMNGVDYFYGKVPPIGAVRGIYRCFPHTMLHSPTKVVDAANWQVGNYATKVVAMHITVTGSPGSSLGFPTLALTSGAAGCRFLTSGGFLNYGLFSVAGFGTIIGGPTGGGTVNLLAGVAGFAATNPATAPSIIVQIGLNLTAIFGSPSTISVPDGESLVFWVEDDPTDTGFGNMQYWTGSFNEQNLCSGYTFLYSGGTGYVFAFVPQFEWSIGLGTLDATSTPVITSTGPGYSSLDPHDALYGFIPGFDQGSGTLTISNVGTLGTEFIGFAVYDENNEFGGTGRLAVANLEGVLGACGTYVPAPGFAGGTPGGGFGGPTLSTLIPQDPRSVGKFDPMSSLVLGNAIWILSTTHNTAAASMNIPWWPGSADISGSNATGTNGGFIIPLPVHPAIPGLVMNWWNWPTDPGGTYLDWNSSKGHSLSNSYQTKFFP